MKGKTLPSSRGSVNISIAALPRRIDENLSTYWLFDPAQLVASVDKEWLANMSKTTKLWSDSFFHEYDAV